MRSPIIVLSSLITVFIGLAISGFISNSDAFVVRCYQYTPTKKNLSSGAPDYIQEVPFKTAANWAIRVDNPMTVCLGGTYICRLCLDDAQITGAVTFAGILTELYNWIRDNGIPTHGTSLILNVAGTNVTVTIYLHTS